MTVKDFIQTIDLNCIDNIKVNNTKVYSLEKYADLNLIRCRINSSIERVELEDSYADNTYEVQLTLELYI